MKRNKGIKNEASVRGIIYAVIATFAARFLGFIRELFVAGVFGTSALGDAFLVSLSIPDILVSGFTTAIATLYIPTYFKVQKEDDDDNTNTKKYNSSVLALVFIICLTITVFTEIFAKFVVNIFAPGFSSSTASTTVFFLRIIIVSTIPIGISGLFKAYGQIVNKFSLLTFAGVTINLSVILALAIFKDSNLELLAYSVILGNLIYLFICYFVIKAKGFSCTSHFKLRNKYLTSLLVGIVPVFVSNIIAEINQIIDKNFASQLIEGSISALNYSSKIINLVTAVIGTAISSVLFANLSKIASNGNKKQLSSEVEKINILVLTLILPMFLFVLFFSKGIIQVLFGRGNFDANSVEITSECLQFYSIGIIGFNLKAIWVRIFNATLDTKTPAINSAIAVGCNIILNFAFISSMQHKGLALATGLASIITDLLLIISFKRKNNNLDILKVAIEFLKIIVACLSYVLAWIIVSALLPQNSNIIIILTWIIWFIFGTSMYVLFLMVLNTTFGKEFKGFFNKKREG